MSNVNALIGQRLKKTEASSKMSEMAKASASGNLTSFAGVFSVTDLSSSEKEKLETLLKAYSKGDENLNKDLGTLISITSEVKAINNQAALLHGERIKRAQKILIHYREGAFTAWLIATYGNRQTPYNLLQYYEFYESLPKTLRPQLETMPRQAIYTLASREGPLEKKRQIVERYAGQTKIELLNLIRESFPLSEKDRRRQNAGDVAIKQLQNICQLLEKKGKQLSRTQKQVMLELVHLLRKQLS
jgi:hypothetical protein